MRFAQEISIFNPFAIERAVIGLDTSITQTAREIELAADAKYAEKGSILDLSSRLSVMADQITSEVTQRENGDLALSSRITQNANSITSEVSARQSADSTLTSKINQSAHTISLSVSGKASKSSGASITITLKDKDGNNISSGSGSILIDGNVVFTSQLSTAGQTTINGGNITTGNINAARIHGGTLKLGGDDNVNGQMRIYNASNTEIGRWNKDGIYIRDGEIYQEKYVDSNVKNAWLRIKSTEITGGYTGLGHTAMVDLQDWQWVTDTGTGNRRREGTLNLKCENGSVAITPDHSFFAQAPNQINILSGEGAVLAYANLSTGAVNTGIAVAPSAIALVAPSDYNGMFMRIPSGTYYGATAIGTGFAPTLDGQRRVCDIVNGLICNIRYA